MSYVQTQESITACLKASIEDAVLSGTEKDDLTALLQGATKELRSFARNTAFKLAKEEVATSHDTQINILKWLEKLMKTLDLAAPEVEADAFFSPGEQCRKVIIDQCLRAVKSIDVCVFTISDNFIRDALLAAHKRGVSIRLLTDNDKTEDLGSDVDFLAGAGIPVRTDISRHHMHHKYAIFDEATLINGSFNWTLSASQYNEENITLINSDALIQAFLKNFETLWQRFK